MKLPFLKSKYPLTVDEEIKRGTSIAMIVAVMIGIVIGVIGVDWFFDNYDLHFQSPIVIRTPMWMTKRNMVSPVVPTATPEPTPTPTATPVPKKQTGVIEQVQAADRPTEYQIVMGKNNGDILWKVYKLESSLGKNDGCRDNGKFNGFGYGQNNTVWNCFDTFEEVAHKVSVWFDTKMKTMSLEQALCYYNTGYVVDRCEYLDKYNAL